MPATLYWRAIKRVQRRALAVRNGNTERDQRLLVEACRTANVLACLAFGR